MSSTTQAPLSAAALARSDRTSTGRFSTAIQAVFERSIAIVVFLLFWEIAPRAGLINRTFLPPFTEVVSVGWAYAVAGKLWPHVEVSLVRALGGFALGVVTAVPLGIVLGWYRRVDTYLSPLLQLLRQTNPVSLFPVFIIFFGIGYLTKVAIIYWVVVWPILLGTINGIRYVDPALVKYARSVALSDRKLFAKVVIPSALPSVITGMRLAATYSFLMLVVSEMVGANSGLGYLVVNSQYLMSIHLLYVGVIILAILGIIANQLLVWLERSLTSWKVDPNT